MGSRADALETAVLAHLPSSSCISAWRAMITDSARAVPRTGSHGRADGGTAGGCGISPQGGPSG
jgi:hypothetical protein